MVLSILTALALAQGSPTMAGPSVAARSSTTVVDYFTSLLANITTECDGSAITASGGETVTFTRATSATCTKSDGTVVTVTSGQPRVSSSGVLIEGPSTNFALFSEQLDNGSGWSCPNITVTANSTAAPNGATTADTLEGSLGGAVCVTPLGITSTTTIVASAYVRTVSGTQDVAIRGWNETAGTVACTATATASTTWQRIACTASGLTSSSTYTVRIYPGGVAGTGTAVFWGIQLESGSVLTSYIGPTTNSSVARNRDVLSFTPGTSIDSAGCFSAVVTYGAYWPGVNRWAATGGGSPLTGNNSTSLVMHDNLNTTTRAVTEMTSRSVTAVSGWGGVATSLTSGGNTTAGTFDGTMGSGTLNIGNSGTASDIYASIRAIKLGASASGCQP